MNKTRAKALKPGVLIRRMMVSDDIDAWLIRGLLGPGRLAQRVHSFADTIAIRAAGQPDMLLLSVADDGTGGADPARGTGLSGLAQRAAVVDGRLTIASPPGGPTTITVQLPLRA